MNTRAFAQVAGLVALVIVGACSGGASATGTTTGGGGGGGGGGVVSDQVTATTGSQFTPSPLNTQVGHTVTWVFQGISHSVLFDAVAGAPANIGVNANTSVGRLFTATGTFTYVCGIHPAMTGTVVVAP